MTMDVTPNTYYVKDGSQRHIVKVLSVSDNTVTFSWMGITFTKDLDEFQRHYTYIQVPAMGDAQ